MGIFSGIGVNLRCLLNNKRPVLNYFFYYLIYWAACSCLTPYLGNYYESRGLTGSQIGMLGSAVSAVIILSSSFTNYMADCTRKPKLILIIALFGMSAAAILIYKSGSYFVLYIAVLLFYFCNAPTLTLPDKLLLDCIQKTPEKYSLYRLGGSIGNAIGSIIVGEIILEFGNETSFHLFVPVMAITAVFAMFLPSPESKTSKQRTAGHLKSLLISNKFYLIYGSLAVWGVTGTSISLFLGIRLLNSGLTSQHLGIVIACNMIGEIVSFIIAPRLLKKFRAEFIMILSFLIQIIRTGTLMLLPPMPILILGQIIGGAGFSLIWASTTQLIDYYYPKSISNTAQGMKTFADMGVGQIIGSLILGSIYQHLGAAYVFGIVTILSIIYTIWLSLACLVKKNLPLT